MSNLSGMYFDLICCVTNLYCKFVFQIFSMPIELHPELLFQKLDICGLVSRNLTISMSAGGGILTPDLTRLRRPTPHYLDPVTSLGAN